MSDTRQNSRDLPNPLPHLGSMLLDVAFVMLFALIGRASHSEGIGLADIASTAWPFVVGALLAGALVLLLHWRPTRPLPAGTLVWLLALLVGMGLRAMTGQGTATAFVIVATISLGIFLLGWRLVPTLVRRRRHRQGAERGGHAATVNRHEQEDPRRRFHDAGEIDTQRHQD